ncbi:MAG: helix-turn-helix transcriptional regulator [Clostridia bacterium]|nr:helix-turn-helix transcriptional regulator [Clostridia bacterium]
MTELRRKKGITQKQAAASLGISQALLSHYEKGVRECGLDFLIKAAAFYEVTADYLLGREKKEQKTFTPYQQASRAFTGANTVIFDMLAATGNGQLLDQASDFLSLAYYRLFRLLYWGGRPAENSFTISHQTYRALADAGMEISEVKLQCVLEGMDVGQYKRVDPHALEVDAQELTKTYGKDYLSLVEVIEKAERRLKER